MQDARSLGRAPLCLCALQPLGPGLADSFERYMAWAETTTDLRYVQNRRDALLKQIIEAGRALDATLAPSAKITHLLDLLRSDATVKPVVELPSLDDWIEAEEWIPDMWSEADLLAEYKAHFGLDNADAQEAAVGHKDVVGDRVRALNHLETVLSVIPAATDRLESWFARPVVKCLRNVGLLTLGNLVQYINVYGYRWHSQIKGFGALRAKQVMQWLILEQDHLHMVISGSVHEPKSKQALRVAAWVTATGTSQGLSQFGVGTLVTSGLARMQATPSLAGERGDFRSHMANTLGAKNDLEALDLWLSLLCREAVHPAQLPERSRAISTLVRAGTEENRFRRSQP